MSLQPYIVKLILDRLETTEFSHTYSMLVFPVLAYLGIFIIFNIVFRLHDYAVSKFLPQLKARITTSLTFYTSHHSFEYFQDNFAGNLADKIKNVVDGFENVLQYCNRFISHFLALVFGCFTLAAVHGFIGLILLIWGSGFILLSLYGMRKIQTLSLRFSESNSNIMGEIIDILSNMTSIKLFTNFSFEENYLKNKLNTAINHNVRFQRFGIKMAILRGASILLLMIACLSILLWGKQQGIVSVGDFGLVFILLGTISKSFWLLSSELTAYAESLGKMKQGLLIVNIPHKIEIFSERKKLKITAGKIVLKDVSFHYPNSSFWLSCPLLTIHPGQKIGLVGYSGSGKSTFVNLLLRLFETESGRIFIDNQDISECSLESLRKQIAIIPQDTMLFHRSLLDNIRYGNTEAAEEDVINAAKLANAHEFITKLPQKYHSFVGERGVKLSGGQRQRIAIARAVLKNAPILILDEATSSLDSVTEQYIQDSLLKITQTKTTIIIAHRISTLKFVDKILVFDNGKIVEDGTHKGLLKKEGLYSTLWKNQIEGFIGDNSRYKDGNII